MTKNSDIEDIYGLLHQNMRDYLTALFTYNALYRDKNRNKYLSDTVTQMNGKEVLEYLSNILDESEILELWNGLNVQNTEENRFLRELYIETRTLYPGYSEWLQDLDSDVSYYVLIYIAYIRSINWFISFYAVKYNNDFSCIDFSNKDLTYINLTNCRNNTLKLSLPISSDHYKNTIVSDNTFKVLRHTSCITALLIIEELNICISGDEKGDVYGWDLVNNKLVLVLNCSLYKQTISNISYFKRNNSFYISVVEGTHALLFCIDANDIIYADIAPIFPCYDFSLKNDWDRYKSSCFFCENDLITCAFSTNLGEIYLFNIDKEELDVLSEGNGSDINKFGIYKYNNQFYCVTANSDMSLNVWNVSEKKLIKKLYGTEKSNCYPVSGITNFNIYSDNDRYSIIFTDHGGGVYFSNDIFGKNTRLRIPETRYFGGANDIEFFEQSDKSIVLTCSEEGFIKWNINRKRQVGVKQFSDKGYSYYFRVDSNRFCVIRRNGFYLYSIEDNNEIFLPYANSEHFPIVATYKMSNSLGIVMGDTFGNITVNMIIDNEIRELYKISGAVPTINHIKAFDRDNKKYIAMATNNGSFIWNADTNCCVSVIEGTTSAVYALAPCCNGNKIITGNSDGTVRVYNITDLKNPIKENDLRGHFNPVYNVEIVSDDTGLVFVTRAKDGSVIVWEKFFDTYKATRVGKIGEKECTSNDKKCECTIDIPTDVHSEDISTIYTVKAIDKHRILTGSIFGQVAIWDTQKEMLGYGKLLSRHHGLVSCFALINEAGNKRILSFSLNGEINQYDFDSLQSKRVVTEYKSEKARNFKQSIYSIEKLANNRCIGLSSDGISIIDIQLGESDKQSSESDEYLYGTIMKKNILHSTDSANMISMFGVLDENHIIVVYENGNIIIKTIDCADDQKTDSKINIMYGISVLDIDLSKAIFIDDRIKKLLKQNGAKVDMM